METSRSETAFDRSGRIFTEPAFGERTSVLTERRGFETSQQAARDVLNRDRSDEPTRDLAPDPFARDEAPAPAAARMPQSSAHSILYNEPEAPAPTAQQQRADVRTPNLFVGFGPFDRSADAASIEPSSTTMQYRDMVRTDAVAEPKREPLTKKQKMSIAIYSAIVVVIAALVIVTGALIGSISADVNALDAQVASQRASIERYEETLGTVSSDAYVAQRAADELGMTEPGASVKIPLVAYEPTAEVTAPSNGFDRFCDWLSQLFD